MTRPLNGPLAGLRVLEFAAIGPGPFAGMMLADLGADVIRVDRVEDCGRRRANSESHSVLDRGRRSIAVDLKSAAGRAMVLDLFGRVDVVVEGFRPGVVERLGVGPAEALARNSRLVYARMTGWGQAGPMSMTAGHDINYLAVAGALQPIVGPGSDQPIPPMNLLGDFGGGGMLLALGILAAVFHAERDGVGQVVDAAIVDGVASMTAMLHGMRAAGTWPGRVGQNLLDGGAPFYRTYRTADDRWLAVGSIEPKFYADLLKGLRLDHVVAAPAQYDRADWPRVHALFAERFVTKTLVEWMDAFGGLDACVAPCRTPDEVLSDPQLLARATYVDVGGVTQPAPAPRFSATPGAIGTTAEVCGTDTVQALLDLGVSAKTVEEALRTGAIAQAVKTGLSPAAAR